MHWPLLEVMWQKWRGGYSTKLQKLVDQVVDNPPEPDWIDFIAGA